MSEALVIIPTYNEKENVERMIRTVFALPTEFDLLIVDDGSPDGTADIVKSLISEFPGRLHIEERTGKLGLGTAYIHGFKWGLKRAFEYFFAMDCDFSHPTDDLLKLYIAVKDGGADVAIGSRYVKGGKVENWPIGRILMSYFASVYVRMVLWMNVMDTTAGFKCYRRSVLETIDLDSVKFVGYAFQIEMKFKLWKKNFKLREHQIIFVNRKLGKSKMDKNIIFEAIFGVIRLKLNSIFKIDE